MKDDTNHMQAQDQDIKLSLLGCGEGGILDQTIHKITSFIRGIIANLGSRSHFTPGSRTHSADPRKSEFPRWR
jgi:hypothetical protein